MGSEMCIRDSARAAMTVRSRAKAAVKRAFNATQSMWIELDFLIAPNIKYDPRNPEVKHDPQVVPVRAVEDGYSIRHVDGIKVRQSDRRFYIDPDDFDVELKVTDKARINGVVYEIVRLTPIQQDVLLEIQLRSAN